MNVMILAAGLGTRMLPHTRRLPKPLFPILDKTLLEIAIDTAKKAAPDRIVVNAHHHADQIAAFLRARDFGVPVELSLEEEILGTAGALKKAGRWLGGEFAVINSDIIAQVDWKRLLNAHRASGALATLMLRANPDPGRYSVVSSNADGRITRIATAVSDDHNHSSAPLMFTGVAALSSVLLERVPSGRNADIVHELYAPMTNAGEALFGLITNTAWTDAGELETYRSAVMERLGPYTGGAAGAQPEGVAITQPVYMEPDASIAPGASLGPCVAIHGGATVGEGAVLKNCVVLPGSAVAAGTGAENEIL